jgi:hypothetical protein
MFASFASAPARAELSGLTDAQLGLDMDLPAGAARQGKARAFAKEADWNQQLSRAYAYQVRRAITPEEAAQLDAEYEQRMAEGPDFLRYRSKSEFMEAPEISMDRDTRHRLMFKFRAVARGSWKIKDKGKHRGVVTRTAEAVFEALMYLAQKHRRLFPSLQGLAYLARCCRASVATALDDLERLGFITRHRRVRRVQLPLGFRTEQTTNAYEVHEPKTAWGRLACTLFGNKRGSSYSTASDSDFYSKQGPGDTAGAREPQTEPSEAEAAALSRLGTTTRGAT